MPDKLFLLAQRHLPLLRLTHWAGHLAGAKRGRLTTWLIRRFIARYRVQMQEALEPNPAAYPTFNDFFTRALQPQARPLARSTWVCPADGVISQCGTIDQGKVLQAKGHHYKVSALLGGDPLAAKNLLHGHFATIYLSPKDYHRVHMPVAGILTRMVYVPGTLYSVNPLTAAHIPELFARNERVICHFTTAHGPIVIVLVGATIVGSMATPWHGVVNPPRRQQPKVWDYVNHPIVLGKGEEMGRFLLGSTVIALWPQTPLHFAPGWQPGASVRMGQAMAMEGART